MYRKIRLIENLKKFLFFWWTKQDPGKGKVPHNLKWGEATLIIISCHLPLELEWNGMWWNAYAYALYILVYAGLCHGSIAKAKHQHANSILVGQKDRDKPRRDGSMEFIPGPCFGGRTESLQLVYSLALIISRSREGWLGGRFALLWLLQSHLY